MILGIRRSSVLTHVSSMPKGKGHPGARQVTTRKKGHRTEKGECKEQNSNKKKYEKLPLCPQL